MADFGHLDTYRAACVALARRVSEILINAAIAQSKYFYDVPLLAHPRTDFPVVLPFPVFTIAIAVGEKGERQKR